MGGRTPQAAPMVPQGNRTPPVEYRAPADWKEGPDPKGMALTVFRIGEGERGAEVSVTPLAGTAGGLLPNVNRWRGQVGLEPISEEQLRREAKSIQLDGNAAQYFDLIGPDSVGPQRKRILAVVALVGGRSWFVKMTGPVDLVGQQKPLFEAFLTTMKFNTGNGGNNE